MTRPDRAILLGCGWALALVACPDSPQLGPDGEPVELGRVRIWTYPKGAKVWVNGELELVTTPSTLIKKAGRYDLRLQVEGGAPYETEVEVEAGETKLLDLDLPRPPDSTISVYADVDGATVRINGYKRGETPLERAVTKPGPIDITVMGPGHRAKSIRSTLDIGENAEFHVTFAAPPSSAEEPGGVGRLTVGMEPPGFVELADGTRLGRAPVVEQVVPAGSLELVLVSEDGRYRRRVEVEVLADQLGVYRFRLGAGDRVED